MDDEIDLREQYYIYTSPVAAGIRKLILKQGEGFLVSDKFGNFRSRLQGELGFYFEGTRYLNILGLKINDEYPLFLYSTTAADGSEILVDLTNNDYSDGHPQVVPRNTVFVRKRLMLYENTLYQTIHLKNYHTSSIDFKLTINYGSDFLDLFEVRGMIRAERGRMIPPRVTRSGVRFAYRGLDHILRSLHLKFHPLPSSVNAEVSEFIIPLQPREEWDMQLWASAVNTPSLRPKKRPLETMISTLHRLAERKDRVSPRIQTSNTSFNNLLWRSLSDLRMLETETSYGPYPFAGIPWFVAPFGRDGLITSLEMLPFLPEMARGTLRFLAAYQGKEKNPLLEEEPGKILHEFRKGEMANLKEIPFVPYFGSVDSTPLFLILLARYVEWTADLSLARELLPNALAALEWIRNFGDLDQDGYIEYAKGSEKGLSNQGWKDSHDSMFHADGTFAEAPIALVEAQGYVFGAYLGMARLAGLLGEKPTEDDLKYRAQEIKRSFNRDFWLEEKGFYAMALDRCKKPCAVISSNPGHALWMGIAEPQKAARVAERMAGEELFCGWGIRTVGKRESRYNPMSYHNGGVWPHDNAIAIAGFKRYHLLEPTRRVTTGLFEASQFLENGRLPELFCGFTRKKGHGPTPYPIACSPQAWSSAAIFLILSSLLGLSADGPNRRLSFGNPVLPEWLDWIEIRNLRVRDTSIDFIARRGRTETTIEVLDKRGEVEITTFG